MERVVKRSCREAVLLVCINDDFIRSERRKAEIPIDMHTYLAYRDEENHE